MFSFIENEMICIKRAVFYSARWFRYASIQNKVKYLEENQPIKSIPKAEQEFSAFCFLANASFFS